MNQLPTNGRVSVEKLTTFTIDALQAAGMNATDAATTARVLVTTDTWGTFSHGTHYLRKYIHKIHAGGINTQAVPQVVQQGPAWAVVDGQAGIGMVVGCYGMEMAIQKAHAGGVGFVTVRNSDHFGAAGYYASMVLVHNMIGISLSNVDPVMAAPGGRTAMMGSNPIAYAAPAGEELPILLDIATTTTAATKIYTAKSLGQPPGPGWLVDADGLPATDYGEWPKTGALAPMAGYKGYGIALLVEVLAGVLSGANITQGVTSWAAQLAQPPGTGHTFIALDIGKFMPIEVFKQRMDGMIREIKAAPRAKGADRIWLPGEMEWERRKAALAEGIPLPGYVLEQLQALAGEMGREFI